MEEKETLFELKVEQDMNEGLRDTGKWAKFAAIAGFVIATVGVLTYALYMYHYSQTRKSEQLHYLFYLVLSGGLIAPFVYLLRFGKKITAAIEGGDQEYFREGLAGLNFAIKIFGVLIATVAAFNLLILIRSFLAFSRQ